MKLFEVSIDNNPGGWKSGNDNHVLVIAESRTDAIDMVKNGYSKKWTMENGQTVFIYGNFEDEKEYISQYARLTAREIRFDGLEITTVREQKLKRIINNGKNEN